MKKRATAWALFVYGKLFIEDRNLAARWQRKYLEVSEFCLGVFGMSVFHAGPPFPLAFPEEGEALEIPANLWRVVVHGYIGPEIKRSSSEWGHIESSAEEETTYDIRKDPVLSACCQFWEASDNTFPPFQDPPGR